LVIEIGLYYDARSKKHQITYNKFSYSVGLQGTLTNGAHVTHCLSGIHLRRCMSNIIPISINSRNIWWSL